MIIDMENLDILSHVPAADEKVKLIPVEKLVSLFLTIFKLWEKEDRASANRQESNNNSANIQTKK